MPNTIDIRRAAEPDIAAILLLYAGDELHGASVDTKPGESHRRQGERRRELARGHDEREGHGCSSGKSD